jgi:hypothetical protein
MHLGMRPRKPTLSETLVSYRKLLKVGLANGFWTDADLERVLSGQTPLLSDVRTTESCHTVQLPCWEGVKVLELSISDKWRVDFLAGIREIVREELQVRQANEIGHKGSRDDTEPLGPAFTVLSTEYVEWIQSTLLDASAFGRGLSEAGFYEDNIRWFQSERERICAELEQPPPANAGSWAFWRKKCADAASRLEELLGLRQYKTLKMCEFKREFPLVWLSAPAGNGCEVEYRLDRTNTSGWKWGLSFNGIGLGGSRETKVEWEPVRSVAVNGRRTLFYIPLVFEARYVIPIRDEKVLGEPSWWVELKEYPNDPMPTGSYRHLTDDECARVLSDFRR